MQERKVKSFILNSLIESNVISNDELDIYEYGLEILKLYTCTFIIIFVISYFTDSFIEAILFFLNFLIIRIYSGGLHLNNRYLCLTVSIIVFVAFPLVFKAYILNPILILPSILLLCIIIARYCPIQSQNKSINNDQYIFFKKMNYKALFIIAIELIIFAYLKQYTYNNIVLGSLLLNTINILFGYYIN